MSIVEKACAKANVQLTADTLPKQDRNVKTFQRVIAALRACEAEMMDRLADAERGENQALRKSLALEEQVHELQKENLALRLREKLEGIEALSQGDRNKVLAIAAPGSNGTAG